VWIAHTPMKKTSRGKARNLIGSRIRQARLNCKPAVTQDDLAGRLAALGIQMDRSAISRIETRERYLMDYEIAAIAKSLKVSVAALFEEE
jgi:transcriptional regulator with XRE-family HTH domain